MISVWFQTYSRSYNGPEMNVVRDKLRALPNDTGSGEAYSSLGYFRPGQNDLQYPIGSVNTRVQLFNLKTWITGEARQYLISGIEDALVDELITLSEEF